MNYIRFWQAAGESEKTSIRTRDRIRQIVSSGHYTGGVVCYGYKLEDQGRRNKRDKPVMDLVIMRKKLHGFGNSFIRLSKKVPADMLWLKC